MCQNIGKCSSRSCLRNLPTAWQLVSPRIPYRQQRQTAAIRTTAQLSAHWTAGDISCAAKCAIQCVFGDRRRTPKSLPGNRSKASHSTYHFPSIVIAHLTAAPKERQSEAERDQKHHGREGTLSSPRKSASASRSRTSLHEDLHVSTHAPLHLTCPVA